MRILVITKETQGQRDNDFCWADEGEIAAFGFECDGEDVDGTCGCRRAMCGTLSHKGSTTIRVEDREGMTLKKLADVLYESQESAGWRPTRKRALEDARELRDMAKVYPAGTVLERRGECFNQRKVNDG